MKGRSSIIITERGKPFAVIRPTERVLPATSLEAKLTELAEENKIMLPRKKFLAKIPLIKISGPRISTTVLKERQ